MTAEVKLISGKAMTNDGDGEWTTTLPKFPISNNGSHDVSEEAKQDKVFFHFVRFCNIFRLGICDSRFA